MTTRGRMRGGRVGREVVRIGRSYWWIVTIEGLRIGIDVKSKLFLGFWRGVCGGIGVGSEVKESTFGEKIFLCVGISGIIVISIVMRSKAMGGMGLIGRCVMML